MADAASEMADERVAPEDAFELLAHETGIRTLEALNEADEPLAFGDLRRRVGADDPGGFQYHLRKLTDRFVENEPTGYGLTTAGARVVGAVYSGELTKTLDADPIPLDTTCSRCHAPLAIRFEADGMAVKCAECGFTDLDLDVPAGVIEGRSREEIPTVVDQWLKRFKASLDYGLCGNCDGRLETTVLVAGDEGTPDWVEKHDYGAAAAYDCQRCGGDWLTSIASAITFRPAVVAFHHDHDITLRKTFAWELDWPVTSAPTVTNRDPLRIEVPITLDDETRVFTLDAALDVVDERRA